MNSYTAVSLAMITPKATDATINKQVLLITAVFGSGVFFVEFQLSVVLEQISFVSAMGLMRTVLTRSFQYTQSCSNT